MLFTHKLVHEVEKRNKSGESLDGLRGEILKYLKVLRDMPTGVAAVSAFARTYGNSRKNATSQLMFISNEPEQLENVAAALVTTAKIVRKRRGLAR